ncbi:MAG: hypothetical protein WBE46_01055 [Dehalococcoidia bacterium]
MARAVAERGAELVEGIHKGHLGGLAITIKQANGLVREVPWDEEDGATPILIEAMILDLEIENLELREATKEYCLNYLKEWSEICENPEEAYNIPISDFYSKAEAFIDGYETALKKTQPVA